MGYSAEEILPVVEKLSYKYTSGESTSVSYEVAVKLRDAAIYCINLYEKEKLQQKLKSNETMTQKAIDFKKNFEKISAMEAYEAGYKRVMELTQDTQKQYNAMINVFRAYGNENYYSTVTKAIPAFFMHYDPLFAPFDSIITFDYPTIRERGNLKGIVEMKRYLDYICLEQRFLASMDAQRVINILTGYQTNYGKQYINLARIVLRKIIINMLFSEKNYKDIEDMSDKINKLPVKILSGMLRIAVQKMVLNDFGGNDRMYAYLSADCGDYAVELKNAAKNGALNNIVDF